MFWGYKAMVLICIRTRTPYDWAKMECAVLFYSTFTSDREKGQKFEGIWAFDDN